LLDTFYFSSGLLAVPIIAQSPGIGAIAYCRADDGIIQLLLAD